MKKILAIAILSCTVWAGESFFGIEMWSTLSADFKNAIGERSIQSCSHYKPTEEPFACVYVVLADNNKIDGIMLFRSSENDTENAKIHKAIVLKLGEKYGSLRCSDLGGGLAKGESCVTKYKNYLIEAKNVRTINYLGVRIKGTVTVEYTNDKGAKSLDKL